MSKVFLDTSYAVALSSPADENHERAVELAEQLEASSSYFVTTRAILPEIGNALSKIRYRAAAVRLLTALEEWGLIDCMSFVVMSEQGLTDALTADNHFRQAGFRALL